MSYIIKMKGSKKNHLMYPGSRTTVCGKKIKSGEIIDQAPSEDELNLCHHCYAWVGKETITEWLGLDFFE